MAEKREIKETYRGIEPTLPGLFVPGAIYRTKIEDNQKNTYTGYGSNRKEADKNASEKYSRRKETRGDETLLVYY